MKQRSHQENFEHYSKRAKHRRSIERRKLRVSFLMTVLAAVLIVPLWWRHTQQEGLLLGASTTKNFSSLSAAGVGGDSLDPMAEFNNRLAQNLNSPVTIKSAHTEGSELFVSFSVANQSLTDLNFPTSAAYIKEKGQSFEVPVKKILTTDDKVMAPVIPAGETREGVAVFPRLINGLYLVYFPALRYQGATQEEFEQHFDLEISDSFLPRS